MCCRQPTRRRPLARPQVHAEHRHRPIDVLQRRRADILDFKYNLARAHRWKRMLDNGRCGSVSDLATAEELDRGYLRRILMLTLLAPDIVEAVMDGRRRAELGVHVLRKGFPVEWGEQRRHIAMVGEQIS
ncbi:MAG TPA: hypothetical protein VMB21_05455 [Candidatus Limnocylindria bacterium]|nr:hypothetical protein [Candidatus Limnocylindria bacterium]